MGAFIFKTEPSEYSYADLVREGRAAWTGITNNAALGHLRTARPGDVVFVYHTGDERAIVGEARVTTRAYADPAKPGVTGKGEVKFAVVDIEPVRAAERALTLGAMKADARFAGLALLTQGRLSVSPVGGEVEGIIRSLTGLDGSAGRGPRGTNGVKAGIGRKREAGKEKKGRRP